MGVQHRWTMGGRGYERRTIDLGLLPVAFSTSCDVEATLPPGIPDVEERLACARLSCRHGVEERGAACLECEHYRGWRDGPGTEHVTVHCGWRSDALVAERMTPARALVSVPATMSCSDADDRALAAHVRHLLVVDGGGALVGVMCRCDLHPAPHAGTRVVDRMSPDMITATPDTTLGEAAAAMQRFGIGCLPVVDGAVPVGVLTRGDLLRIGVPASLVGGDDCTACGSRHGVRADPHSGLQLCLSCLELFDELDDPRNFGQGD